MDATKITYCLAMFSRDDLRPAAATPATLEVRQVGIPCPEFSWFLHQAVGVEFRWGGRQGWGRREWAGHVAQPGLETWVGYVQGTPAGYFELAKQEDGSVRIECFGLLRQFFGQKLGGALLTRAVERCWEMGANRVWLRTCSHDHPHALQNYLARGFQLVEQTTGPTNPPYESALFKVDPR
ncbi:MAG: GNAT family N-acetyltransferase [Thermoguttaceae bacterium]|nr:GNAT family N-acetyltransferase [Thermoguttaceae bacterium]